MKQGCHSAISPCSHQRNDPTTICEICQKANDDYRAHTEKQATDRAVRILRERGYTVIEPNQGQSMPVIDGVLELFPGADKQALNCLAALMAKEIGSITPEPIWKTMHIKPVTGRKIVALYSDGSGASMFFVHDNGFIDCEGDDYNEINGYDRWAYLPDELEFWCEVRSEDQMTFPPFAEQH